MIFRKLNNISLILTFSGSFPDFPGIVGSSFTPTPWGAKNRVLLGGPDGAKINLLPLAFAQTLWHSKVGGRGKSIDFQAIL
jgi:hypothetical protein